jgi:hypothetical protein
MTREQLEKVPFRMAGHVSMEHEHTATYVNQQYGFVMVCRTKVTKNGTDFGKTRRVFIYEYKKYNKLEDFLEAIKDVEFNEEKQ